MSDLTKPIQAENHGNPRSRSCDSHKTSTSQIPVCCYVDKMTFEEFLEVLYKNISHKCLKSEGKYENAFFEEQGWLLWNFMHNTHFNKSFIEIVRYIVNLQVNEHGHFIGNLFAKSELLVFNSNDGINQTLLEAIKSTARSDIYNRVLECVKTHIRHMSHSVVSSDLQKDNHEFLNLEETVPTSTVS